MKVPDPALLFLVLSFSEEDLFLDFKRGVERLFSEVVFESSLLPKWTPAPWERLRKHPGRITRILVFYRRIHREELPDVSIKCSELELQYSKKDPSFTLFPGYVTSQNIVIANEWEDLHRIYLFKGVFAEIVYKYQSGQLKPEESALDFFKSKEAIFFFTSLHENYEFNKKKG